MLNMIILYNCVDYQIYKYEVEKSLQWISGRKSRLSLKYRYANKVKDFINSKEKAVFNDVKLKWQYNLVNKSALTSSISYVNINYDGSSNSSLNYVMLDYIYLNFYISIMPVHIYSEYLEFSLFLQLRLQYSYLNLY